MKVHDMTTEEKIRILSKAILSLAQNADNGWLYGEDAHQIEQLLQEQPSNNRPESKE